MRELSARARRHGEQTRLDEERLDLEGERLEFQKFAERRGHGHLAREMRGLWYLAEDMGIGQGQLATFLGGAAAAAVASRIPGGVALLRSFRQWRMGRRLAGRARQRERPW